MSGQREARYDTGPGYRAGNSPDAGPTVRTSLTPIRPAEHIAPARSLQGLGDALGSFFGAAQKTAETLEEIQHRENLLTIKRQNEVREMQATADAAAGTPMNQEQAQYWSYYSTYARANGRSMGGDDFREWETVVQAAPKDGSFDYEGQAKKFLESKFGSGSGDAGHDAAYLTTWKNASDTLRAQHNESVSKTLRANASTAFVNNAAQVITTYQGAPDGMVDGMFAEALSIAQGDVNAANTLMFNGLRGAIVNRGQAQSILLGSAASEWGKKNPAVHAALSDAAWKQIASIQTQETYEALDNLRGKATELSTRPDATGDDFIGLITEAKESARKLGAERDHDAIIGSLIDTARTRFRQEARVNEFLNTVNSEDGTYVGTVSRGVKASTYAEDYTTGFNTYAEQRAGAYPSLQQAKRGGIVDYAASPQHAQEFARLITEPRFMRAVADPVPPAYSKAINADLISADPQRAANTFRSMLEVEKLAGVDYVNRILDSDAQRVYQRVRRYESMSKRAEDYFATREQTPGRDGVLDGIKSGDLKWAPLIGGTDEAKARTRVDDLIHGKLLEDQGLKSMWSWLPFVSDPKLAIPDDRLMDDLRSEIALSLADQKANAADKLSLDEATSLMVERMRGKLMVQKGRDGGLKVIRAPYGVNEGRAAHSPLSEAGGRPVYALGKVTDATGKVVDTNETAAEDFRTLAMRFPGYGLVSENLALGQYRDGPEKGLWDLHHKGNGIEFELGSKLAVADDNGDELEQDIPKDLSAAVAFFDFQLKGTGFRVEPSEVYGRPTVRLVYGPRIERDTAWARAEFERKQAEHARINNMDPAHRAAMDRFNEVQSKRVASGRLSGVRND